MNELNLIEQQTNFMIRGKFIEAWKLAEEIENKYPENPAGKFNRGWLLINKGDLFEGYKNLEYGRAVNVYGFGAINSDTPMWKGEDLMGKTLLINLEGSLAENILIARYATEVWNRGGKTILCCNKILHSAFERIPGVLKCATAEQAEKEEYDYWIPGLSCTWVFGKNIPSDPYLFAKQESVQNWKNIIRSNKKLKIGINWHGENDKDKGQFRPIPKEKFLKLINNTDVIDWYSLKKENTEKMPEGVNDLQFFIISLEDTLACIENLDLVITSCPYISHIASAMGKPTWVILPILTNHIWASGKKHSPWYSKNTVLFRQKKFGEWDDVINEVSKRLSTLAK